MSKVSPSVIIKTAGFESFESQTEVDAKKTTSGIPPQHESDPRHHLSFHFEVFIAIPCHTFKNMPIAKNKLKFFCTGQHKLRGFPAICIDPESFSPEW